MSSRWTCHRQWPRPPSLTMAPAWGCTPAPWPWKEFLLSATRREDLRGGEGRRAAADLQLCSRPPMRACLRHVGLRLHSLPPPSGQRLLLGSWSARPQQPSSACDARRAPCRGATLPPCFADGGGALPDLDGYCRSPAAASQASSTGRYQSRRWPGQRPDRSSSRRGVRDGGTLWCPSALETMRTATGPELDVSRRPAEPSRPASFHASAGLVGAAPTSPPGRGRGANGLQYAAGVHVLADGAGATTVPKRRRWPDSPVGARLAEHGPSCPNSPALASAKRAAPRS